MIYLTDKPELAVIFECVFSFTPIYALYYTLIELLPDIFYSISILFHIERGVGFITSYNAGMCCIIISGIIATIGIILLELRLSKIKNKKKSFTVLRKRPIINTEVNMNLNEDSESGIIRIENISKIYSDGFEALRNINLDIPRGYIFGLLGPNGAGKSTLFNIATLQTQRSEGDIFIEKRSIYKDNGINISLCPQGNPCWEYLTVEEHIQFISQLKGLSQSEAKIQVGL